jgi:hypothetical protein
MVQGDNTLLDVFDICQTAEFHRGLGSQRQSRNRKKISVFLQPWPSSGPTSEISLVDV